MQRSERERRIESAWERSRDWFYPGGGGQEEGIHLFLPAVSPERIREGFGEQKAAEDPFDATLGVMSMTEIALGYRDEGAPQDDDVRQVEGWILGQEA